MNKNLKDIKKEINSKAKSKSLKKDENGKVVVDMAVKDDSGFLSVFSNSATPVISEEVASFLENKVESLKKKEQVSLKIYSDCIDEDEKKLYKEATKEYYLEKYKSTKQEIKKFYIISLILALAGLVVLAFSICFQYNFLSLIWAEAIDIVAWVLLWEATDLFLFKIVLLKRNLKKYLILYSMDIGYLTLTNSQE